jgi:hypothetical protein
MFVREEARLPVRFAIACTALARLAWGDRLLDASQGAYGGAVSGLAKVGPPGPWPDSSKLVMVHVGDVTASGNEARMPLRWEATGLGNGLFPALDADVSVTPAEDQTTILTLTGVYRPPLGRLGAMLDRAVLSRVAAATIRDFVARLALVIADSSTQDEQGDMDAVGS